MPSKRNLDEEEEEEEYYYEEEAPRPSSKRSNRSSRRNITDDYEEEEVRMPSSFRSMRSLVRSESVRSSIRESCRNLEVTTENLMTSNRFWKILVIALAISVIILVIALITAFMYLSKDEGDNNSAPITPTLAPTITPQPTNSPSVSLMPTSQRNSQISGIIASFFPDFFPSSNLQKEVLTWFFETDALSSEIDAEPLLEKYILAVLYMATDGDNWDNSNGWLTDQPVCTWTGITCDSSDRVDGIDLRKCFS